LRADGHHRERCCHDPVDAVLGPLEDSEKSGNLPVNIGNEWAVPPVMLAVDPTLIIILTAKPPSIAMLTSLLHSCQPALRNLRACGRGVPAAFHDQEAQNAVRQALDLETPGRRDDFCRGCLRWLPTMIG